MLTIYARTLVSCLAVLGAANVAHAQELTPEQQALFDQMVRNAGGDPAALKAAQAQAKANAQWNDVVRYSAIGVYRERTNVSSDQNWLAYADVSDRIEMQFDWKMSDAQLLGTPTIQNHKATLANPRNPEAKCAPPTVNGPFEYDLKSVEQGIGANLRIHVQTSYPPVQVHQFCTGAMKSIPAKQRTQPQEFMVPPPTMLSMSLPAGGTVTRSSDGKSLILKNDGWTWTFTPRNK